MDYRARDFPLAKPRSQARLTALRYLPGAFMLLVLAGGLALSLLSPATFELPTGEAVLDGSWTASYQRNYEAGLVSREPALNLWSALTFSLFREGRPGVLIGQRNWLFVNEEFFSFNPQALSYQANLRFMLAVAGYLERLGIRLLVAPIPAKASIYPERLGRYALPESAQARYGAFLADLAALGIPAVDLRAPMLAAKPQELMFLPSDTHWTPQGAKVSAAAIAAEVAEAELFPALGEQPYQLIKVGKERHRGDLRTFLPFGFLEPLMRFPPDRLERFVAEPVGGLGSDLFAEVHIPVALVGTSFSADSRWAFQGALQAALGADVLNAAAPGVGPFNPMLRYLQSAAFRSSPPELVIWEIPERYLSAHYPLPQTLEQLSAAVSP